MIEGAFKEARAVGKKEAHEDDHQPQKREGRLLELAFHHKHYTWTHFVLLTDFIVRRRGPTA